jgi:hypothetical protein
MELQPGPPFNHITVRSRSAICRFWKCQKKRLPLCSGVISTCLGRVLTQSVQATCKGIELTLHASSAKGHLADPAENERNSRPRSFALPRGRQGDLTRAIASKISPKAASFLTICLSRATCWADRLRLGEYQIGSQEAEMIIVLLRVERE